MTIPPLENTSNPVILLDDHRPGCVLATPQHLKSLDRQQLMHHAIRVEDLRAAAERTLETYKRSIRIISERLFADIRPTRKWRIWARRVMGMLATNNMKAAAAALRNQELVGFCKACGINLYGLGQPAKSTLPCNVLGCPFEKPEDQEPIEEADLLTLVEGKQ